MKFLRIFFLLAPLYIVSCKGPQQLPSYLDNVIDTTGKPTLPVPELRIEKNDLLSIQVYSLSTDPKIDMLYNYPAPEGEKSPVGGFLVDGDGNLEYPRLGIIHAEGMTKAELAAEIKKRLTEPVELLRSPSVIIRFINFRVTILGEVAKTGSIPVPGERLTILEAIGLSGDVTKYGKKTAVKVIREVDGKREIGIIDLTSEKVFESPYYNLKQNDVILVEARKDRSNPENQQIVAQRISFALGVITSAAFIYNIFK
jgi:polysaccharide export outer membrane protein